MEEMRREVEEIDAERERHELTQRIARARADQAAGFPEAPAIQLPVRIKEADALSKEKSFATPRSIQEQINEISNIFLGNANELSKPNQ